MAKGEMSALDWIAYVLLVIGGLNWGLVGAFNVDLVQMIFGSIPLLAKIVYIVVGLCAVYVIVKLAMKK